MAFDADLSRRVLGAFVTSVTLVSSHTGEHDHVATVSSFSVASFSAPRVSISLSAHSRLAAMIQCAGVWGVSLLDGGAAELARFFAQRGRAHGAGLERIAHTRGQVTGVVLFDQAVATLECRTVGQLDSGNYVLFLGEPVGMSIPAAGPRPGGEPPEGGPDQPAARVSPAPLCHFRGALYRPIVEPGTESAADLLFHLMECDHGEGGLL